VDLNDTPEQAEYRAKVRSWIEANKAGAPGLGGAELGKEEAWIAQRRDWQRKLAEGGFAGVTWPAEFGGQGLGPINQVIITQELQEAGVPGILDVIGIGMLGPTVIAHGTDDQKQRYLAPMLAADEVWCQLFSEPAAGSDLAGIQTKAEVQPDGSWKLNGQKVWTTNAHFASYGLILARTNSDVPKHKGMSMFIVPMDAEGVTIRPLRQITGEAEFNEVFFDGARTARDLVVGEPGKGWKVALATLAYERGVGLLGHLLSFRRELDHLVEVAQENGRAEDPVVRQRLARSYVELEVLRFNTLRSLSGYDGPVAPAEASIIKLFWAGWHQRLGELAIDVLGPAGLVAESFPYELDEFQRTFLFSRSETIYGGSDEIQRNIIGERVLGLPPEPKVDKR